MITLTDEQIRSDLKTFIGGTDAAAILGVHPWRSAYQVWAEKTGRIEGAEENEPMLWGKLLEPIVADEYARRTGRKVRRINEAVRHKEFPFLGGHIDRWVFAKDRQESGVLEVKTANAFFADQWAQEPPIFYQVQLQHYLMITGRSWGSLAVLIGGNLFRWLDCERNEKLCAALLSIEKAWWERHIVGGAEPDPDGSESTRETLAKLFPEDNGQVIELAEEAAVWTQEIEEAQAAEKAATARIDAAKNKIRAALGAAMKGILPGGMGAWTNKHQVRAAYRVPESEGRVLRRASK